MNKLLFLACTAIITYLSLGNSLVFAQSPRDYYDWSSSTQTQKVLGLVYAQEATPTATSRDYQRYDNYLFGKDLTPDKPIYFLKSWQEGVSLSLTFNPVAKEELRLKIAGERLEELENISEGTNQQALDKAVKRYQDTLNECTDKIAELNNENSQKASLLKQLDQEAAKHTIVLEEVSIRVPESAQEAIEDAIDASNNSADVVADLSGKPAVPTELVDRLQALKAQGLLTEDETAKLVGVKTRVEAREEIKKYVEEGIVPESDYIALNENLKDSYPQEFYQLHEIKRFYELKRLEAQKPDDNTLTKIQEFAKSYKPGDVVPSDIRRFWVPVVRLEEIQNTFRPDLIDEELLKGSKDDYQKFTEVVERFKPRPEDIAQVKGYMEKNNITLSQLPIEYQRMYSLGQRYGAQCGSGYKWYLPTTGVGGYCAPDNFDSSQINEAAFKGNTSSCKGGYVSAKGPGNACSTFPSDCLPAGWSKVVSCVQVPTASNSTAKISCPNNAHFVAVSYSPDGGYCVPNYTTLGGVVVPTAISASESCPSGYSRSYSNGPCMPPITSTPGNYPSPVYANYSPLSKDEQERVCKAGNGTCDWSSGICNCRGYQSPSTGYGGSSGSTSGSYDASAAMRACQSGGGYCEWQNNGTFCYCRYGSSGSTSGSSGSTTGSSSGSSTAPPSGYGTCASGQYWNGSTCITSTTSTSGSTSSSWTPNASNRDQQEAMCKSGGGTCSWNNDVCNCQGYQSSGSTTSNTTTSTPTTTATPAPTPQPDTSTQPQATPDPNVGCASVGMVWNGSGCVSP